MLLVGPSWSMPNGQPPSSSVPPRLLQEESPGYRAWSRISPECSANRRGHAKAVWARASRPSPSVRFRRGHASCTTFPVRYTSRTFRPPTSTAAPYGASAWPTLLAAPSPVVRPHPRGSQTRPVTSLPPEIASACGAGTVLLPRSRRAFMCSRRAPSSPRSGN